MAQEFTDSNGTGQRKPIIAGNWKMNTTVEEAMNLVSQLSANLGALAAKGVETVVAPPHVSLVAVRSLTRDSGLKLAAQNMYHRDSGAFTGEISPLMLKGMCDYVIIGHSERRQYFHETDEDVNLKVKAAFKHNLIPIVAVGENLAEREAGQTTQVITSQVLQALKDLDQGEVARLVIAYEPVWAIGTGKAATAEIANSVAHLIRQTLIERWGVEAANQVRIQYGGSVTGDNIAEYIGQPDIDGALVGGASLKVAEFVKIVTNTTRLQGAN